MGFFLDLIFSSIDVSLLFYQHHMVKITVAFCISLKNLIV